MTRHDAEVHRVIVDARNLLEREGGLVCCAVSGDTHVTAEGSCSELALREAAGGYEEALPAAKAFCRANGLGPNGAEGFDLRWRLPIWRFNDGHSYPEVLAAFDRAINATAPPPHDPLNDMDPTSDTRVRELVR